MLDSIDNVELNMPTVARVLHYDTLECHFSHMIVLVNVIRRSIEEHFCQFAKIRSAS